MSRNEHLGSTLGSLFDELGAREELDLLTRKKIIAQRLHEAMEPQSTTKQALAEAMQTSRTLVYRLLDPSDTSITLSTLAKASKALGLELHVSFSEPDAA